MRVRELEEEARRAELAAAEEKLLAHEQALAKARQAIEVEERSVTELQQRLDLPRLGLARVALDAARRRETALRPLGAELRNAVNQRRAALGVARAERRAVELGLERVQAAEAADRARAEVRAADDQTSIRAARALLQT